MKIAKIVGCILFISGYTFCDPDKQPIQATTLHCPGLPIQKSIFDYLNPWPKPQISRMEKLIQEEVIQHPARDFKFNDEKGCLGQDDDIETLHNQIKAIDGDVIADSQSRGSSTLISCMAKHNCPNVKALIIDAAPSDMVRRVEQITYTKGLPPIFNSRHRQERILRKFYHGYPANSIPPVQAIPNIQDKSLAALIFHSKTDTIVDMRDALDNYKAFRQAGFAHVYLCQLESGGHDHNADGKSKDIYKTVKHSFLKMHNLHHNPKHATLDDLSHLQPTIEDVDAQIKHREEKLLNQHQKLWARNSMIGINAVFALAAIMQKK